LIDDGSKDFFDAIWLGLLEAHLLNKDWPAAEKNAAEAVEKLTAFPEARVVAAYLRVVAVILSGKDVAVIAKEPAYSEMLALRKGGATIKITWQNGKGAELALQPGTIDPPAKAFFSQTTDMIFGARALKSTVFSMVEGGACEGYCARYNALTDQ